MKVKVVTHSDSYWFEESVHDMIKRIEDGRHTIVDIKYSYHWISFNSAKYSAMIIYK